MAPVTRLRSRVAGIDYLYNFITGFKNIEAVAIEHTTGMEGANTLAARLSASHPGVTILRSTVSPVLGVYGGPNALAVTVLEAQGK
jgi:fatty acid-binding protein DegV